MSDPSPELFFETVWGYQRTAALKGYEQPRPVWVTTFTRLERYLAEQGSPAAR